MSPRLKKRRSGLSLRMHAGGQFEAYSSSSTGSAEPGSRREIRRSDVQDPPTELCVGYTHGMLRLQITATTLPSQRRSRCVCRCRSCCTKDSVL